MNRCGNTDDRAACLVALLRNAGYYGGAYAEDRAQSVTLTLGDYRFDPDRIEASAGQPVTSVLVNRDGITPHDFTLRDAQASLDLDVDVPAGQTTEVHFEISTAGTCPFYCNKKLPFMKSHRDRGMQGRLIMNAAR